MPSEKKGQKAAKILGYALVSSSASVCLQALEITVVLGSFEHEIRLCFDIGALAQNLHYL